MNVMPGDAGYPAEIEVTLPENMLAIPFGSSEAEVVAEHEDGTRTWRYDKTAPEAFSTPGTISGRTSRPAA